MKSPLTLALGIYIICFTPALALSDLVTRQACDEFYCSDWDFVLKSLGGAAGAAAGAASRWLDFSQPPYPETVPAPDTAPTEPQDSQVRPAPNNPAELQADPETAPAPDIDPTESQDSQVRPALKNPFEPQANTELWIQSPPPELSGCQAVAPSSNSDAKDNLVSHFSTPRWINCPQVCNILMPSGAR